jgi:hypothetical protein
MAIKSYVIGFKSFSKYDNYGVKYHIGYDADGRMVTVWEGPLGGNGRSGSTLNPQELLQRLKNGKSFRRYFEITECEWFIPYIERMAEGDDVQIEEIRQAYKNNNAGADLPAID